MFEYSNLSNIRKYGTERVERLLSLLGNPDSKLKIVHIAGSNGKGSCAAYISNILKAAGKRVGTFTSPAVYSYEDQFSIDCTPIQTQKLQAYLTEVQGIANTMKDFPSPFEVETATAIYAFYKEGCDFAVIECGLGGREDATNAIGVKELAIITSVTLEHTKELGNTIKEICVAKAGIVKACPLVVSSLQPKEAEEYFKSIGAIFAGEGLKETEEGFILNGEAYKIKLANTQQRHNAATAVVACKMLNIGEAAIKKGLASTQLAGRCQVINRGNKTYVLDGAHNPAALAPLIALTKSQTKCKRLIFGCLSDKDVSKMAALLAPCFNSATLFSPNNQRGMPLEEIERAFKGKINYQTAQTVTDALSGATEDFIAVCGSFTALKESKSWIDKRQ